MADLEAQDAAVALEFLSNYIVNHKEDLQNFTSPPDSSSDEGNDSSNPSLDKLYNED